MEAGLDYNVVGLVEVHGMIIGMGETEVSNGMTLAVVDMAEEADVVEEEEAEGRHQSPWANGDAASRFHTAVVHRMGEVEGEGMVIEKLASWATCDRA